MNNNLGHITQQHSLTTSKEKPVQHFVEDIDATEASSDADAKRLESLGYKQEFNREISLFVQAGFAFSCMGVLPNWQVIVH